MFGDKNITLVNDNDLNSYSEIELLCAFELENDRYIIYSKNESDFDGNVIVYSGKIVMKNDKQYVCNTSDDEHDKVKKIIKTMINYGSEGTNV